MSVENLPPAAVAKLDQLAAEADMKYAELVGILQSLTEERGEYLALAYLGSSLLRAPKEALVSIILTGMRRETKVE